MNAPISTVESDSQWVLTKHATSATYIMATEVLVLSLSHSPCLHMISLTIFLLFSCMNSHTITITVRKSIFIHLSSEGPLVQRQDNVLMADYHDRTMSHCKIHKAITITSRCKIFHRSGYCGVLSVLLLYTRGSRTLSDPRPRSRGQSRCV